MTSLSSVFEILRYDYGRYGGLTIVHGGYLGVLITNLTFVFVITLENGRLR